MIAVALVIYKYFDYVENPWTRDGQVRAQVVQIAARVSGPIINLPIEDNQFVKAGDLLFEIEPSVFIAELKKATIDGFFRENYIAGIEKGDEAVVTLMSYPDKPIKGRVESVGWGISQDDGSTGEELLPTISPTFEWIRLAQRIAVSIKIVELPKGVKLRVGTTASVLVRKGTSGSKVAKKPVAVPRVLE